MCCYPFILSCPTCACMHVFYVCTTALSADHAFVCTLARLHVLLFNVQEPLNIRILQKRLAQLGIKNVIAASDGVEALEKYRKENGKYASSLSTVIESQSTLQGRSRDALSSSVQGIETKTESATLSKPSDDGQGRRGSTAARSTEINSGEEKRGSFCVSPSKGQIFPLSSTLHDLPDVVSTSGQNGACLFTAVLTDINMPRMDGVELGRKLRAECHYGGLLIAITADGREGLREEARTSGFDVFLKKPFSSLQLKDALCISTGE
mmetsp:Transcript_37674/g.97193  ORF Transcript_37674/g.97193 Transcript_37674/m.97193 type:complete len:265 (-) Transcript_37674:117-911(-)